MSEELSPLGRFLIQHYRVNPEQGKDEMTFEQFCKQFSLTSDPARVLMSKAQRDGLITKRRVGKVVYYAPVDSLEWQTFLTSSRVNP